ncbi:MAG: MgtC/SapB family protein [Actinomycetota bacterium]|nr:MgtC/SapB family protein [Actinomycetota bacterium]
MISDGTIVVRILLAAALGAVIGVERELRDQPAGLRTHLLVSLGSCLFALVGAVGFQTFAPGNSDVVRADVTRVASQIVVGIGFLGGGTILRSGQTIRGLTTAASLWVTAAVGLAVAVGFYTGALTVAGLTILALAGFKPLEKRLTRFRRQQPPEEDG